MLFIRKAEEATLSTNNSYMLRCVPADSPFDAYGELICIIVVCVAPDKLL